MKFLVMDFSMRVKLMTPLGDVETTPEEEAELQAEIENSEELQVLKDGLKKAMSSIPNVVAETDVTLNGVGVETLQ